MKRIKKGKGRKINTNQFYRVQSLVNDLYREGLNKEDIIQMIDTAWDNIISEK
jgi:hypothetical protein